MCTNVHRSTINILILFIRIVMQWRHCVMRSRVLLVRQVVKFRTNFDLIFLQNKTYQPRSYFTHKKRNFLVDVICKENQRVNSFDRVLLQNKKLLHLQNRGQSVILYIDVRKTKGWIRLPECNAEALVVAALELRHLIWESHNLLAHITSTGKNHRKLRENHRKTQIDILQVCQKNISNHTCDSFRKN